MTRVCGPDRNVTNPHGFHTVNVRDSCSIREWWKGVSTEGRLRRSSYDTWLQRSASPKHSSGFASL